jgi:hypothetical protein
MKKEEETLKCRACGHDRFRMERRETFHTMICRNCETKIIGCMLKCIPCGRMLFFPWKSIPFIARWEYRCVQCRNFLTVAEDTVTVKKLPPAPFMGVHKDMHYWTIFLVLFVYLALVCKAGIRAFYLNKILFISCRWICIGDGNGMVGVVCLPLT